MKYILLAIFFLNTSIDIAVAKLIESEKLVLTEKFKLLVVEELKDPDSAKFKNLSISEINYTPALCGEINAKNSYGAYVGFKKFYVTQDKNEISPSEASYVYYCGN